jgi:hypothetical protein
VPSVIRRIIFIYSLLSLCPNCDPGVGSASNRNEYQEYFLGAKGGPCVMPTMLPPACADFLEVWEPQPPGILRASSGLYRDCCTVGSVRLLILHGAKKINYFKEYDNKQQSNFKWEERIYNHLCLIKLWGKLRIMGRRVRGRCQLCILPECLALTYLYKQVFNVMLQNHITCIGWSNLSAVFII